MSDYMATFSAHINASGTLCDWLAAEREVSTIRTPYQNHAALNHRTTEYSPDGINRIEECAECGARFMHSINDKCPRTLY